jgi:hypothetical protein
MKERCVDTREHVDIPLTIRVEKILESRYPRHARPSSWDERRDGKDIVLTPDGKTITLWSDGQQSPPQPGWEIVLREYEPGVGYTWTLYGMNQ